MTEETKEALAIALKKLEAMDRTEAEIRKLLAKFSPGSIEEVIEFLNQKRMLNDLRVASRLVEKHQSRKALGDSGLIAKLNAKGASESVIEAALSNAPSEESRIEALLGANPKYLGDRGKMARFLYGKGFSEESIESALERHFSRLDDEES